MINKTIRKNAHKMIAKIIAGFQSGKIYTLDNYFNGEPFTSLDIASIMNNWYSGSYFDYNFEKKEYTFHVHSNYWFRFKSTFEPKPPKINKT